MATVNETMTNLANAIREKTGTSQPLSLDQMAVEVMTIENNGETTEQPAYLDKVGLQRLWANGVNKFASKGHVSVTSLDANGQIPDGQTPDTSSIPVTSVIPADAEIWIDEEDESTEESHVYNKSNPHRVTTEQIGAAPAVHAEQHMGSDTLTWDGVVGDRVVVNATNADGMIMHFVHMSYASPSWAMLYGKASCAWTMPSGTNEFDANDDYLVQETDDVIWFGFLMIAAADNVSVTETITGSVITLPKKGIYFAKTTSDDGNYYVSRLTVPGCAISGGSDPITPDMICAAPENHASADAKYGMANYENFGHVKLIQLPLIHDQESDDWLDMDGNFVATWDEMYDGTTGLAASAYAVSALCMIMTGSFQDYDEQLNNLGSSFNNLLEQISGLGKSSTLYDSGDIHVLTTGGWTSESAGGVLGYINMDNIELRCYDDLGSRDGAFYTANPINLSGYTQLHARVNITRNDGYFHMGVSNTRGTAAPGADGTFISKTSKTSTGSYELVLDISSIDRGFVGFHADVASATITRVWLT